MLKTTCPNCKAALEIPEQFAGQIGTCRHCNHKFTAPSLPVLPVFDSAQTPSRKSTPSTQKILVVTAVLVSIIGGMMFLDAKARSADNATMAPANYTAKPKSQPESAIEKMSALQQCVVAFEGRHTAQAIKALMDPILTYGKLPLNDDSYSRFGSALVVLRQDSGIHEVEILKYMNASIVPGSNIDVPTFAGMAVGFMQSGDTIAQNGSTSLGDLLTSMKSAVDSAP